MIKNIIIGILVLSLIGCGIALNQSNIKKNSTSDNLEFINGVYAESIACMSYEEIGNKYYDYCNDVTSKASRLSLMWAEYHQDSLIIQELNKLLSN